MKNLKICLAALVGLLLGVLIHPMATHAQANYVHVNVIQATKTYDNIMRGSEVLGFSCVHEGDSTTCYVATREGAR
jgi:hypothetical protein